MSNKGNLRFGDFNSLHDYGLLITDWEIGMPELKTVYVDIPYRSGSFDFTDIYGSSAYTDRVIKVTFQIDKLAHLHMSEIYGVYDSVVSEILGAGIKELELDFVEGIFTGRCTKVSPVSVFDLTGSIEVEWTCNPFRVSKEYIGCTDIWNEFYPFSLHVFSDCEHENFTGTADIRLWNNSAIDVTPVIIVEKAPFTITQNGVSHTFTIGTHEIHGITLKPSRWNEMQIQCNGVGNLFFKWKRVYI